ncbi:MAG: hypothetical protein WCU88_00265 [Elusimicrobiota bacterium]|jgi:hypothetical protein
MRTLRLTFLCIATLAWTAQGRAWDWHAAVKDSGRSHCDPGKLPARPTLLLIGECHDCASSKLIKQEMARRSAKDEFYTALESGLDQGFYPWDKTQAVKEFNLDPQQKVDLYPIDPPLAYGLTVFEKMLEETVVHEDVDMFPEEMSRLWLRSLLVMSYSTRGNPYAQRAWESAVASFEGDEKLKSVAHILNSISESSQNLSTDNCIDRYFGGKNALPFHVQAFKQVAIRYHDAYVALINEKFLLAMGLSEELQYLSKGQILTGNKAWLVLESNFKILINVRNRDFSDNIADIYCQAGLSGRNLVVSIGYVHVPGVEARLRKWSRSIPLRVEQSFAHKEDPTLALTDLDAAEPILKLLSDLAQPAPKQVPAVSPQLGAEIETLGSRPVRFDGK